ncbi:unnamed protein product [Gongylonema pulchrum]|uniref:WD_REPEATS_REGION domain-containing protein n=1 Tax=Gongylonema pulchrum TaxID=637853 RepID=A0A183DJN2_9BILA|nr:unnamed protein product [Gongylonema pulchrum]
MSPSGKSFAISANRHLRLYSTEEPTKSFELILDVHDKPISRLRMSPCGKMLGSCGDRYIRIFHNVAEFYGEVGSLKTAARCAPDEARRRRFEEQLQEAEQNLSRFPIP